LAGVIVAGFLLFPRRKRIAASPMCFRHSRSFRENADSRRRPLVEHLLPDVDGDALEALRQKRQEEPVVPARRRVQPIDDVRLEHREREGQKKLRARALVGDDVADHVLVDVGPLDGRRVLDLDLIRLLQRRRIALFLALPRGEVIEGRTRQRATINQLINRWNRAVLGLL
jgi:hypothetical protein